MTGQPHTYTANYNVFRDVRIGPFRYRSDLIDDNYMRRWTLLTPFGQLRVHKILRSDNDRHFHDHPFDFVSIILRGGYIEHRPKEGSEIFLPGHVLFRKATALHYLKLLSPSPTWTLVVATHNKRAWGFQTEDGWIDARDYDEWLAARAA